MSLYTSTKTQEPLTQLVECLPYKQDVLGSSPRWLTNLLESFNGRTEYFEYSNHCSNQCSSAISKMKRQRLKRSIVWLIEKEQFSTIVSKAVSFSEIVRNCGLIPKGSNIRTIKARIETDRLDTSHILRSNLGRKFAGNGAPLETLLIENYQGSRNSLKSRLLKAGLLKNECSICFLNGVWNCKPIVMHLDHINGIYNDYRLGNLRMVCPNCDSQLDTYSGKNNKKNANKICYRCLEPRKSRHDKVSRLCLNCCNKDREVIEWPSDEQLVYRYSAQSAVSLAKELGVSDNAIHKRIKRIENSRPLELGAQ